VGTFCAASVDTFIHAMIQREEGNSPSAALTQNAAMQTSGDFSLNTGEVKEIVNGAYFNSAPIPVGIVDSVAFRNDLFAACMVKNQHWSPLK
jgi:hypothetical protein